jgi:hypothetical protein
MIQADRILAGSSYERPPGDCLRRKLMDRSDRRLGHRRGRMTAMKERIELSMDDQVTEESDHRATGRSRAIAST